MSKTVSPDPRLPHLERVIEHAAHLLPAQGPITVFIHHNTLHAFEDMPFTEGVKVGARVFGCEPYLSEARYRTELARDRIRVDDLEAVLRKDLGPLADEILPTLTTRGQLRLAMLRHPLWTGPAAELRWFVAETDALRRVRSDAPPQARRQFIDRTRHWFMRDIGPAKRETIPAMLLGLFDRFPMGRVEAWSETEWEEFALHALWRVCVSGVEPVPASPRIPREVVRHRDLLREVTGVDADLPVNELMIRFCAVYLDQGFASWGLPGRDQGFFRSFCELYRMPGGPPDRWLSAVRPALDRIVTTDQGPVESILESLDALGVPESEYEDYLSATFLSLRGWGGMVREIEHRGDRVPHPVAQGSLIEFIAVRLLLDRASLATTARQTIGYDQPLSDLRTTLSLMAPAQESPQSVEPRAFQLFQIAQVFGWSAADLLHLDADGWKKLVSEIEAFSPVERRRLFHLAYERRFRNRTLDALSLHVPRLRPASVRPRFQLVCCLDEREESFRRHAEEVAPDVETFGIAGFYGVPMYYRGVADAHYVPLCPIVIQPQHWVTEEVVDHRLDAHQFRASARRAVGTASHKFHLGTRSFAAGALLTAGVGVLASIPLVARILFPRLTARFRRRFGRMVQAPPETRLHLERTETTPGMENGRVGFNVEEMTNMAERQLRDIGLTRDYARIVVFLGHGSGSLNNPHKSAYDCGACGGSPGAPNGRALAQILNDARVRSRLRDRGLNIPDDTVFVGGIHNTCNDGVTLFDLDRVPETHRQELAAVERDLSEISDRNAHERCRRFMSAPLSLSFRGARQHVEGRSEDLAQTRPELGHATNAICIVGRRARTRGLYFDRRAFLVSYDPLADTPEHMILARLLSAAVPVCGGINLEYYFSHVDSAGYGCGTKLPHNVSGLVGVMDGAASDLRTGLPWQMVEIHEPVRLLFVLETTPEAILKIMEQSEVIGRPIRNGWVQLAVLDPHSSKIQVYRDGIFHEYRPETETLPKAATSTDWYRGWRDHLTFAEIGD